MTVCYSKDRMRASMKRTWDTNGCNFEHRCYD
jgi:hypothetical protein